MKIPGLKIGTHSPLYNVCPNCGNGILTYQFVNAYHLFECSCGFRRSWKDMKQDKTLGIRPDRPSTTLGEELAKTMLGPERVKRHKGLMRRMDALGMNAEEKVKLVARAVGDIAMFDLDLQLDRIEYLIECKEKEKGIFNGN